MADTPTQIMFTTKMYNMFCENIPGDYWTGLFVGLDYWPIIINFILVGILLEHTEVFYSAFFWSFFADQMINWAWRAIFNDMGPQPICAAPIQMPAYATDGIAFITLYLMICSSVCFNFSLRWYKILLIGVFGPITVYGRIYLKMNTPQQLLAGVLSGTGCAFVFILITYWVLTRKYESLVYKVFFGTQYIDTLINQFRPVLCTNNIPVEFKWKVKDQEYMETLLQEKDINKKIAELLRRNDIEVRDEQTDELVEGLLNIFNPPTRWVNKIE